MTTTAGTHTYTLPAGVMTVKEVLNTEGSTDWTFERSTLAEIINYRRAQGAAPARYYAVEGSNMLTLYPTPGDGETITVWYVPAVTAMTGSSQTPTGVPAEFQQAIEFYALARAAEFDQHAASQFGTYWLARYEQLVRECRKANRQHGGQRTARIRLGKRDKVSLMSDPSRIRW